MKIDIFRGQSGIVNHFLKLEYILLNPIIKKKHLFVS